MTIHLATLGSSAPALSQYELRIPVFRKPNLRNETRNGIDDFFFFEQIRNQRARVDFKSPSLMGPRQFWGEAIKCR